MLPLSFKEAAQAVGSSTNLEGKFDSICTDTRKITCGSLFIAIKGENFDGHDFAEKAIESGAKAVICEKDCRLGENQILVESTRQALLDLAGYYRSLFNIPVIGITGSVGKTRLCPQNIILSKMRAISTMKSVFLSLFSGLKKNMRRRLSKWE